MGRLKGLVKLVKAIFIVWTGEVLIAVGFMVYPYVYETTTNTANGSLWGGIFSASVLFVFLIWGIYFWYRGFRLIR